MRALAHVAAAISRLIGRAGCAAVLASAGRAFGVVLLVVNIVTIIVGFVVLFTVGWLLGLVFLVASIPLWINGLLFERRYSVVARRSQDQVGDLTDLLVVSLQLLGADPDDLVLTGG